MNVFLSEKPVMVRVLAYEGEPGSERPTLARFTYDLDIVPDDLWTLCWELPSTSKVAPMKLASKPEVTGHTLSFECVVDRLDEARAEIERRIIEANRQKDGALSRRKAKSGAPDEEQVRESILERLSADLGESLGMDVVGDSESDPSPSESRDLDSTRLEDWN